MFLLFSFLMSLTLTGSLIHEILGILVLIIIIIHLLFNFKIIKNIINKFKNMSTKNKINIILDLFILIDFLLIIITGILISQNLFAFINVNNLLFWSDLHHFVAYLGICLIGIHIGFHLLPIIKYLENKLKISGFKYKSVGYLIVSLFIFVNGIYNIIKPVFYKNIFLNKDKSTTVKDSDNITSSSINDNSSSKMTLNEYLKDLHCNGCSRHCSLANPLCNRSAIYIEEATTKYNSIYGSETSQSLSNDSNLQDYLSKLNCNGCHNNCSLANVKCAVGAVTVDNATIEYNKTSQSNQIVEIDNDNINLFGYMSIISFFALGTHYTIKIINKNNKIN